MQPPAPAAAAAAAILVAATVLRVASARSLCSHSGQGSMGHLWGDALEGVDCAGPDGAPYPRQQVDALVMSMLPKRRGRKLFPSRHPLDVRRELLEQYAALQYGLETFDLHNHRRTARAVKSNVTTTVKPKVKTAKTTVKPPAITTTTTTTAAATTKRPAKKPVTTTSARPSASTAAPRPSPPAPPANTGGAACGGPPARLCRTRYNTTAPMYGVSLTSGKPVTIVQKFPDLLQQVIFEVCETSHCDVLHGECVQTYTPHLFLVIPLGPVTLTGQDYVLVESGCVCRPKYTQQDTALPLDGFGRR